MKNWTKSDSGLQYWTLLIIVALAVFIIAASRIPSAQEKACADKGGVIVYSAVWPSDIFRRPVCVKKLD